MLTSKITREQALELLKKSQQGDVSYPARTDCRGCDALVREGTRLRRRGGILGDHRALHDIDFELYPEQHCQKAPELLREGGVGEDMIYSICSHGYGLCCDLEPKLEMEKVLFAADELTGLIWSAALMRPSKSVMIMELKRPEMKKYKDKKFCGRMFP